MSLGNPTNIVIIALLGLAALLFIVASFSGGGKWRRLYQEESEDYAAYADRADDDLRAARQRIAELEASHTALQQEHSDALAEIARLKSAPHAAEAPVVAPLVSPAVLDAPAPAIAPPSASEPRPIAPEAVAAETDARPIAPFGAPMTELPPAPIHGVTPLRAVDPAEPEMAVPVADAAPSVMEPARAVPEAHSETAQGDAPDHANKSSTFATLAHLAEGAAVAEVAHLAWNAYSAHKHHAEAEHAAEPEAVSHATVEHAVDAPHTAPTAPVAETADIAPASEAPAKAWFGAGKRDDLMRMRGVDSVMNTRLFGLGVTSFDDVVQLSQEDEMALEQRLGVPAGYITREQWREQASLLRFGKDAEFEERFGSANA